MSLIYKLLDFHPSKKYPGMTVEDYIHDFISTITFSDLRFSIKMHYYKKYGHKIPVYSAVFHKYGYMLENGWFVPDDNSFSYGYDPNCF